MHWTGNASLQFAYFFLLLSANKPAGHYTHRTGWKNTQTHLYSFICPLVASICPFDRLSVRHRRYIALPYEPLIHQRLIGRCVRFLVQFASTDYAVHSPCACIILYPPNVEKWKAFFVVAFPFDYMYEYIYAHIGRSVLCCIYSESRVVCLACIAGHIPLSHPSTTHRRAHVSKATTQIHKAQTHSVNRRFFPLSLFRLPELKRRDEKFRRNAGAVFACISICVHRYCFIFVPATVCPNG